MSRAGEQTPAGARLQRAKAAYEDIRAQGASLTADIQRMLPPKPAAAPPAAVLVGFEEPAAAQVPLSSFFQRKSPRAASPRSPSPPRPAGLGAETGGAGGGAFPTPPRSAKPSPSAAAAAGPTALPTARLAAGFLSDMGGVATSPSAPPLAPAAAATPASAAAAAQSTVAGLMAGVLPMALPTVGRPSQRAGDTGMPGASASASAGGGAGSADAVLAALASERHKREQAEALASALRHQILSSLGPAGASLLGATTGSASATAISASALGIDSGVAGGATVPIGLLPHLGAHVQPSPSAGAGGSPSLPISAAARAAAALLPDATATTVGHIPGGAVDGVAVAMLAAAPRSQPFQPPAPPQQATAVAAPAGSGPIETTVRSIAAAAAGRIGVFAGVPVPASGATAGLASALVAAPQLTTVAAVGPSGGIAGAAPAASISRDAGSLVTSVHQHVGSSAAGAVASAWRPTAIVRPLGASSGGVPTLNGTSTSAPASHSNAGSTAASDSAAGGSDSAAREGGADMTAPPIAAAPPRRSAGGAGTFTVPAGSAPPLHAGARASSSGPVVDGPRRAGGAGFLRTTMTYAGLQAQLHEQRAAALAVHAAAALQSGTDDSLGPAGASGTTGDPAAASSSSSPVRAVAGAHAAPHPLQHRSASTPTRMARPVGEGGDTPPAATGKFRRAGWDSPAAAEPVPGHRASSPHARTVHISYAGRQASASGRALTGHASAADDGSSQRLSRQPSQKQVTLSVTRGQLRPSLAHASPPRESASVGRAPAAGDADAPRATSDEFSTDREHKSKRRSRSRSKGRSAGGHHSSSGADDENRARVLSHRSSGGFAHIAADVRAPPADDDMHGSAAGDDDARAGDAVGSGTSGAHSQLAEAFAAFVANKMASTESAAQEYQALAAERSAQVEQLLVQLQAAREDVTVAEGSSRRAQVQVLALEKVVHKLQKELEEQKAAAAAALARPTPAGHSPSSNSSSSRAAGGRGGDSRHAAGAAGRSAAGSTSGSSAVPAAGTKVVATVARGAVHVTQLASVPRRADDRASVDQGASSSPSAPAPGSGAATAHASHRPPPAPPAADAAAARDLRQLQESHDQLVRTLAEADATIARLEGITRTADDARERAEREVVHQQELQAARHAQLTAALARAEEEATRLMLAVQTRDREISVLREAVSNEARRASASATTTDAWERRCDDQGHEILALRSQVTSQQAEIVALKRALQTANERAASLAATAALGASRTVVEPSQHVVEEPPAPKRRVSPAASKPARAASDGSSAPAGSSAAPVADLLAARRFAPHDTDPAAASTRDAEPVPGDSSPAARRTSPRKAVESVIVVRAKGPSASPNVAVRISDEVVLTPGRTSAGGAAATAVPASALADPAALSPLAEFAPQLRSRGTETSHAGARTTPPGAVAAAARLPADASKPAASGAPATPTGDRMRASSMPSSGARSTRLHLRSPPPPPGQPALALTAPAIASPPAVRTAGRPGSTRTPADGGIGLAHLSARAAAAGAASLTRTSPAHVAGGGGLMTPSRVRSASADVGRASGAPSASRAAAVGGAGTAAGGAGASRHSLSGLTPPRQRTTLPVRVANHRRILNALGSVLLAGPQNTEKLRAARRAVDSYRDKQMVLALVSTGSRSFSGVLGAYAVVEDEGHAAALAAAHRIPSAASILAERVYGSGPVVLTPPMIRTMFKFDTASHQFKEIGNSSALTVTTDAVGIDLMHLVADAHADGPSVPYRARPSASE